MADRIVFISYSIGRGGSSKVMTLLQNKCAQDGCEVSFVVHDIVQLYHLENNIKIIELSKERKICKLNFIWFVRKYIKQNKIDTVISFLLVPNLINIIACWGLKCKCIISERNDPRKYNKIWQIIIKTLYRYSDCIVFQTEYAKSFYPDSVKDKGVIIRNPITVSTLARKSTYKIVSAGRMEEQKNQKLLIKAFHNISDLYPEYQLYIFGDGSLRNELIQLVSEYKLEDRVFFPGNVMDIHERIADAVCFVLPSNYEGLSNAMMEAMMMGIPVISTRCAGSNELIKDKENGLLIDIDDEMGLTFALKRIIGEPELRKKLSQNGKITSECFSANMILKKWTDIIYYSNDR